MSLAIGRSYIPRVSIRSSQTLENMVFTVRACIKIGFAVAAFGQCRAADPALVRIVLLDTSGSMAGERLTTAKAELRELGRTLPPAADRPVIVVPFTDRLGKVVECTDLATLEACLDKAEADGGTRIALALERALDELHKHPHCRHASVFLYTDGEDGDQEGISRQELRLDRLFADREKRGLNQSVIFCKRWQNANAGLLKQIRERGHARVLDAGEARLRPIFLKAQVTCLKSTWTSESSLLLDVDFTATLEAVGAAGLMLPEVPLRCVEPQASGERTTGLLVGRPKVIRLRLPVPLDAGATLPVRCQLGEAKEALVGKDLILPQLTGDLIVVAVPIPTRMGAYALRATATAGKGSHWIDPESRRTRLPLDLAITVEPPQGETYIGPIRLQAKPSAGWTTASPTVFSIGDGQPLQVRVVLDGRFPERMPRLALPLELRVTGAPPGVVVTPAHVNLMADVLPPPPASVSLQHHVRGVGAARWTDPANSVASFAAEVELTVVGPLPPDSEVLVRSAGGVRSVRFRPSVVRPGSQTIRMEVEAEMKALKTIPFRFDLIPPKSSEAIEVQPPPPISFDATGPPPLQIALARDGHVPARVTLVTRERQARLRVTPVLVGANDARPAAGLPVMIGGGSGLEWGSDGAATLNEARDLSVALPADLEVSFFRDTLCDAELRVESGLHSSALVGSTQTVRLRVEAPFKRYLFYGVGVMGSALMLWFLGRTVYRIVTPEVIGLPARR